MSMYDTSKKWLTKTLIRLFAFLLFANFEDRFCREEAHVYFVDPVCVKKVIYF